MLADPGYPALYFGLGTLCRRQGRCEPARQAASQIGLPQPGGHRLGVVLARAAALRRKRPLPQGGTDLGQRGATGADPPAGERPEVNPLPQLARSTKFLAVQGSSGVRSPAKGDYATRSAGFRRNIPEKGARARRPMPARAGGAAPRPTTEHASGSSFRPFFGLCFLPLRFMVGA